MNHKAWRQGKDPMMLLFSVIAPAREIRKHITSNSNISRINIVLFIVQRKRKRGKIYRDRHQSNSIVKRRGKIDPGCSSNIYKVKQVIVVNDDDNDAFDELMLDVHQVVFCQEKRAAACADYH